ncbi:MAG: ABC transporter permease [Actinomycetota bacterium]|nr:ABC transporter permease [Actinomycetota bacterium]
MSAARPTSVPLLRLTPLALARPGRARRLVERNLVVYRRGWTYVVSGFFEPFLYLLSIGVGLGHLVGSQRVGGHPVGYAAFAAPGLLASSAMNGGILDTTYGLFFKLKYAHTYEAVLSTPLTSADVAVGEVASAFLRGSVYSAAFLAVMAGLGLVGSPWALCCLPIAALVGLAFASLGLAVTAHLRSWQDVDMVALAVLPMFLFSATFYPLSIYPGAVGWLVRVTPLYQGVVLLRAFDLGAVTPGLWWHAAYLVVLAGVSLSVAAGRLRRLLVP